MSDVKLFRPQRLTDNDDGGGLATAIEVVDGQVNNLFDDISRIDRVNGELSLRKVFAQAATADTERYSDLHVIVQTPPGDPRVAAVLFRTPGWNDMRSDAQSQVERYLDESVISRMIPYDRQLQGQRTVLVYQRPELSLPEIGEVYALKVDATGVVEFIRVADMAHQVETFTDPNGDYRARVITLTLTQPLSREFAGSQPNRYFTVDAGKAVVRKTIASDAARYKGVVELAQDAAPGDLIIRVASVFAQLVPAATAEVAVVDAVPAGASKLVASSSGDPVSISQSTYNAFGLMGLNLTTGAVLGSLEYSANILRYGVADYGRGFFEVGGNNNGVETTLTYLPAVEVAESGLSYQIPVEIQNRGYVYAATLRPIPAPGSTVASFRALGKWYTLVDDGTGALVGGSGVGSGLVNFQTGSVQLTLGALPDIGSAVLLAYGGSTEYEVLDTDPAIAVPAIVFELAAGNCEPGTLTLSWPSGVATKTATDDGSGALTGDATGRVIYATGEVVLRPAAMPNSDAVITAAYEGGANEQELFTPSAVAGSLVLSLGSAPVRPGSISVDYSGVAESVLATASVAHRLTDNGLGQLVDAAGAIVAGSAVDYVDGQVSFSPTFSTPSPTLERTAYSNPIPARVASPSTGQIPVGNQSLMWPTKVATTPKFAQFQNGSPVVVRYKPDVAVDATVTAETIEVPSLQVDFTPQVTSPIVPTSLVFTLGGRTYYERQGTLYHSMNPATGAGSAAGSIDLVSGVATITSWAPGAALAFDVKSLLSMVAPLPLAVVHGRTPGSPLRPGTFSLQANRYDDSVLIAGVADNNGNISTADMRGHVDVTTGVFSVAFGAYVLDSSLSGADKAEAWYTVDGVDPEGYIWRPREVMPGTVRFNCVVQTSLPQDPDIIGVNPVRLPMDGRVQAFRPGDTLVIHDTQPQTLASPLTAGQVVALPRAGVASVALYDQAGQGVDAALYTFDAAAGDITFATPLDLSDYEQPLVALHTVEDMALCLDAQITGELSLGHALTHGYSVGQSLVSSALILGDAQARYSSLFVQATWTNVWDDAIIGAAPASGSAYNAATYPIQVLNRDAITQRWRLAFTSATTYNIVGEEVGVIGTGTTATDAAPLNPATGQPYFRVLAAGFGGGWSTGNTIRFNTVAAGGPIWAARTVLSGPATVQDDLLRLQLRWDKD